MKTEKMADLTTSLRDEVCVSSATSHPSTDHPDIPLHTKNGCSSVLVPVCFSTGPEPRHDICVANCSGRLCPKPGLVPVAPLQRKTTAPGSSWSAPQSTAVVQLSTHGWLGSGFKNGGSVFAQSSKSSGCQAVSQPMTPGCRGRVTAVIGGFFSRLLFGAFSPSAMILKVLLWTPHWDEFQFAFVAGVGSVHHGADHFLAVASYMACSARLLG